MTTTYTAGLDYAKSRLEAAGYSVKECGDILLVSDPIQCSCGGGKKWVEYEDVKITCFIDAIRFLDARS